MRALENPQALVSDGARQALERAASGFPDGEPVVGQAMGTGPAERKRAAAGLLSPANRIEHGEERKRAVYASKTAIRPLREKLRTQR